jgi:hypothetical protein
MNRDMNWEYTLDFVATHAVFTMGFVFINEIPYLLALIISLGPAYLLNKTLYELKLSIRNTNSDTDTE